MSFSGEIKEELLFVTGNSRHCQMAPGGEKITLVENHWSATT